MHNILYIENAIGPGGASISLSYLLSYLDRSKYQPFVVLSHKDNFLISRNPDIHTIYISAGISKSSKLSDRISKFLQLILGGKGKKLSKKLISLMNYSSVPLFLVKVYPFSCSRHISLIHLNNSITCNLNGILLAKLLRVPCICHQRGFEYLSKSTRIISKLVDHYIAVSEAVKQNLLELKVPSNKISVVYEGVDLEEYDPRKPPLKSLLVEFNLDPSQPRIGMISFLVKWKGHEIFLRAFAKVVNKFPNCKALIVGDIPADLPVFQQYKRKLIDLSRELGIEDNVIFAGHREDIPEIIRIMDIIVHASILPEPFGRVIIEAMAMEKPVIATNIGGPKEIIKNEENGILVNPCDPEEMAAAILKLLQNKKLAEKLGRAGRETVERFFSIETHVSKIEEVYRMVLREYQGRRPKRNHAIA